MMRYLFARSGKLPCRRSCSHLQLFVLAAILCACAQVFAATTFTVSFDRDTIKLGESAGLSLTFSGGTPQNVPAIPNVPSLQINYIGPSSQFSVINGEVSSMVTYNFTATPRQAGEFTVPAIAAVVGGQTISSQPVKLTVTPPTAPTAQAANSGRELALLKMELPRKEAYIGELIPVKLSLYLRNNIQRLMNFQLSPFDGFTTIGKMVEGRRSQTQIGNSIYTVIPLEITVQPVKTGTQTVGPAMANFVVELPSANRGDPFFGFFNRSEQQQVSVASEPAPLQVLPLPANAPADFSGAIGSYTLTMTAGPTNVAVGDPITLRVVVSGRGPFDSLNLPTQSAWHDFKLYPPTSKIDITDEPGVQGSKTFEQIIVPENADIKELPGFSFSYFDPAQKAYRTLTQPPLPLTVRPSASQAAPTFVTARNPSDTPPPSQDIVHIKQRLGALAHIGTPLFQQTWFLAAQGVPVVAWVGMFLWRKRTDNLANNPRLRRQRHVAHLVHDGLGELRRFAANKKSDEFFALMFRLLQESLGERLDLPASAITEAVVEDQLRPRGVSEQILALLRELFQTCNLARYAPIKTSQELAAMIPKLEGALEGLKVLKA